MKNNQINKSNRVAPVKTYILDENFASLANMRQCSYCECFVESLADVAVYSEIEVFAKHSRRKYVKRVESLENLCETCVLRVVGDSEMILFDAEIEPASKIYRETLSGNSEVPHIDFKSLEVR